MNKDTRFIITVAGGIITGLLLLAIITATNWFLYGIEIKTSHLKASQFIIGDPIINVDTYEIALIDLPIITYVDARMNNPPVVEWYITDWVSLHEAIKDDNGKPVLADPVLRWASRIQRLFGKRIK